MNSTVSDSIDIHGDPIAFKMRPGRGRSSLHTIEGRDVIKVEARKMAGQQKEAVVTDGEAGGVWRMACDEGKQLRGTDLAPFPLGYFNAGMQADIRLRMQLLAAQHDVKIDGLEIWLINPYWLTGSFVHGTAEAHAEPADIEVRVRSQADIASIEALVAAALDASPVVALQRQAIADSTFALYINGRRRDVVGVIGSTSPDVADPYRVYTSAPRPLADATCHRSIVEKLDKREEGTTPIAPNTVVGQPVIRNIYGLGQPVDDQPLYGVETWLGLPGSTHYRIDSDTVASEVAPSPLAMVSAAIAFCYLTQLTRYVETMKMKIDGVRLVQFNPFRAGSMAAADPIDTHLFLNGEAAEETHANLLTIAAHTCYLHASVRTALDPKVRIVRL